MKLLLLLQTQIFEKYIFCIGLNNNFFSKKI